MLVNSKKMLAEAKKNNCAVLHFNINNLEWTKYILEECERLGVDVILGVSEGAIKYMGGYNTVAMLVKGLIKDMNIKIGVCLHLDHGSTVESCKKAIDAGFTSVMIDASKYKIDENIKYTKQVVDYAHVKGVTTEAEIGLIGGSEDDINNDIFLARLDECIKLYESTNIDSLAPAVGSVHGLYKEEANLNFSLIKEIADHLPIPLVLHGATGIEVEKIKKAIACGICKININTELQVVWSKEIRKFIKENELVYDPRKIIGSGKDAMQKRIREIISDFRL